MGWDVKRGFTDRQAKGILMAGIVLFSTAIGLALYSVPSEVPGLPSFPFFSFPFPILPLLLTLGTAFIAMGWIFHSRGSFSQLLVGAATFVSAGLIWEAINFVTAIPFEFEGITIYVMPYGAHAALVLTTGLLLVFFGLVYWALDRWEKRRQRRSFEKRQPTLQN